jgi:cytoskeletal protein CcmA (bactofilin family)
LLYIPDLKILRVHVQSGPFNRIVYRHRFLILLGLMLLAVLLVVPSVWAAESRSGEQVIIGPEEVIDDDLYATANEVVVEGTIRGDLVAFGQSVTVDGAVEGDLIAAGQSVEIGGTVDDDARIAGQALLLSEGASVGDDLIAAAYSLENEPESNVGGTVWYAGYQALLAGTVSEDLAGAVNALTLGGELGGDVDVDVDGEDGEAAPPVFVPLPQAPIPTVEPGLTLTDSALIGGNLTYQSSTEAQIDPGAQIEGDVVREERPVEEEEEATRSPVAEAMVDALRSLVSLVLVGLLLVWLAPGWIRRRAYTVLERPLASLGWGLLGLIAFLILGIVILLVTILLAIVLGLLTLGGLVTLTIILGLLAEAALVLIFLISTSYLAQIIVSFLAGVLLLESVLPGRGAARVLPLVVGLIVYVILRTVPVLGPIIGLIVVLLGVGALLRWVWTTVRRGHTR